MYAIGAVILRGFGKKAIAVCIRIVGFLCKYHSKHRAKYAFV